VNATGTVGDTYLAAVQHGLVEVAPETTTLGVVRRPTRWFAGTVDENRPALGPPEPLLDEFQTRREDFEMRGLCEEGAHNAAWDEVRFGERYRSHLDDDDDARAALSALVDRVRAGADVTLVCYENTSKKRCHRTILREEVERRLS
jgi:hypothetical protein